MQLFKLSAAIYSFLLCVLLQLCCHNPTRNQTLAAPTVVVTAIEVVENIMKRETDSEHQNRNQELQSRVEQAVNISLSEFSSDVNKKNLTNNIVKQLIAGGIEEICPTKCKPRSKSYLAELFLRSNAPSCLYLQHITLDTIEEGLTIYALGGNATCERITYAEQCLSQQPDEPIACSWTTTFQEITQLQSDQYFPHYMLNVDCHGCSEPHAPSCPSYAPGCFYREKKVRFNLLKATGECDSEGYEEWEPDYQLQKVNAGCSCKFAG